MHHDHSSGPAEGSGPVLPLTQRPLSHASGTTNIRTRLMQIHRNLFELLNSISVFEILKTNSKMNAFPFRLDLFFFLKSAVTLDDVFSFLAHFRADESLCRGTPLWKQVNRHFLS